MTENEWWLAALTFTVAWALLQVIRRVEDLEEDVALLVDGEKELAVAKRKLSGRQVARETGKDRL